MICSMCDQYFRRLNDDHSDLPVVCPKCFALTFAKSPDEVDTDPNVATVIAKHRQRAEMDATVYCERLMVDAAEVERLREDLRLICAMLDGVYRRENPELVADGIPPPDWVTAAHSTAEAHDALAGEEESDG